MRPVTFKWILLASAVVIGGIVALQLFWLNDQYKREQKQFSIDVVKSVRGLYDDFNIQNIGNLQRSIEFPDNNTFLIRLDTMISESTFTDSLRSELEQANVFTDCKAGVYDIKQRKYAYEVYIPAAASGFVTNTENALPVFKRDYSYLQLSFPHRDRYIESRMIFWIVSFIVLILLLIGFALSLFFLFRQKFVNEIQNDFIRNVTHEFQTPLTTLTLGLDMISKPSTISNPEKLHKYTKLMQDQTSYLKQHIQNLIKVLKTDAHGLVLKKEKLSPDELLRSAVQQLEGAIDEKGAKVSINFSDESTFISGDRNGLFVAFINIISNALKYSKDPLIIINTKSNAEHFYISIKDNGIGIEEKYQKFLFKRFYRVPTGDLHSVKGLGLGLYFVKKVIDAHKGKIVLTSVPESGTEFIITLPKN